MKYILSIDQGTTGTTCVLIDAVTLGLIAKSSMEHPQIYPTPGWVEHSLDDIWKTIEKTTQALLKGNNIDASDIISIGITNQRETTCAFDKLGNPLHNAIVWQDRRTSDFCKELIDSGKENKIKEKTGLPIDPYFSATKMHWYLNNCDKVKKAAKRSDLLLGTVDTFILYKLTGGESFTTEVTNASRTLLMDLKTCSWDNELLDIFGVDRSYLPQIKSSIEEFGKTKDLSFLPNGIPITGILGDQQAALFGQAGFSKSDIKCTYGTGAFILLNTGKEIVRSNSGLVSTVAYKHQNTINYALEGSCFIAGAAVQWLRDELKIIKKSSDIEQLAKQVSELSQMERLIFFPFFTGIGSPHWNPQACATIYGLTRGSSDAHLARACLDGIALSINDLIDCMKKDAQISIPFLKVDGGACENNLLMSIQATISDLEIIKPSIIETTAYGAALAAAVGMGIIKIDQIKDLWKKDRSIGPIGDQVEFYQRKKASWIRILKQIYL